MKKFLSLVLALVMAMSLVTVSAGAKDFNDGDKISDIAYEEAVNVMSEMGIIDGYGDGNFQPQGTLTRGAAAKIIACMMLGKTTAEALGTQAAPFKDVPVGSTFAGYIAYCSESGIIDGYSDGTFRPGNTLTGFAFLKMLLTALGYDSDIEGYANNANWTVNVAGRAKQIGLLDGNDNFVGTRAATREEACLYAVNALQATLVEYTDKGGSISVGDITINTGASNATYVTSNIYDQATSIDATRDNSNDWTVEFAEKYQPDLRLDREVDAFGRPSHTWTWKRVEIGSYIDQDKLVTEYTTKVTGRDLYDLLGSYVVDNDTFVVTIDGVDDVRVNNAIFGANNIIKSNTKAVGETGNGVLTQVFRDSAEGITYIAIINTYLAEATDDFDEDDDVLDVDVYGYDEAARVKNTALDVPNEDCEISPMEADNENVAVSGYEDGDIILVRIADGEILEVMDPEVLADSTVTAFSLTKDTVTSGGTVYDKADTRLYDLGVLDDIDDYTGVPQSLKDLTFNIILDPYGYVIGIERNEDPDQYVFITGYEPYTKNLSTAKAEAGAIFVDGTMENIDVKVSGDLVNNETAYANELDWDPLGDPVLNRWYAYTVDKNGVYTLRNIMKANANDPFVAVADGGDAEDDIAIDDVAQFAWAYTVDKDIDKSHISLPAWADNAGDTQGPVAAPTGVDQVVYGNADTVYLTVDTDDLANTSVGNAVIIDSVKSVTVGVKNANLVVDGYAANIVRNNTSAGVYTLYNDKGYIVASVVVGEDAAAATSYVYVTSSNASLEEDLGEDNDSRWTREVFVNGELKDLVYVGDQIDYIGRNCATPMLQGNIYKVSYNANGEVIDSEWVVDVNTLTGIPNVNAANDQVTTNIRAIEADGGEDFVLLAVDLIWRTAADNDNELNFSKFTLYTTQAQTEGFSVADDAKVLLVENITGDNTLFDEFTVFDSKDDNVKDALKALYTDESNNIDHNDPFNGVVYAILEDGMATSLIIVDNEERPDVDDGGVVIPGDNVAVNGNITLTIPAGLTALSVRMSDNGAISYGFEQTHRNTDITYDREIKVNNRVVSNVKVTATADNGGNVTGSANISAFYDVGDKVQVTISNIAPVTAETPFMWIKVDYKDENGAIIESGIAKKVLETAATDGNVVVTAENPDETKYVIVGADKQNVPFVAGTSETVTFTVKEIVPEETPVTIKVSATGDTKVTIGGTSKGDEGVFNNNYQVGDSIEFSVTPDASIKNPVVTVTFNGDEKTADSRGMYSATLNIDGENTLDVTVVEGTFTLSTKLTASTSNTGFKITNLTVFGEKYKEGTPITVELERDAVGVFPSAALKKFEIGDGTNSITGDVTFTDGTNKVNPTYDNKTYANRTEAQTAIEGGKVYVEDDSGNKVLATIADWDANPSETFYVLTNTPSDGTPAKVSFTFEMPAYDFDVTVLKFTA